MTEKVKEMVNEEVTEITEVEEVKESKVKALASKAGGAVKKHSKKIAAAVGIGVGGAVLYALGKRAGKDDDDDNYVEDVAFEVIDCTDVDDDTEE